MNKEKEPQKESQADILIRLGLQGEFYCDQDERLFVTCDVKGNRELVPIGNSKHKSILTREFYLETGKAPNLDSLNQAISTLKAIAMVDGKRCRLHKRVAFRNGFVYYFLADKESRVIRISPKGLRYTEKAIHLFEKSGGMKGQVDPDFPNGDIRLLRKHLRLKNNRDWIIFLAYIVTCFIPDIPHPILLVAGEKGAAKSTFLRMLKAIVDPSSRDLLVMPNATNELALTLSKNYLSCFDNLTGLSSEKSDILCMASTGGSISKRKLYTDDDEVTMSFKHCVALNGINIVATKADLLDRSIIIELERIPEDERKEEALIWQEFYNDLPKILGGILNTLSGAMRIHPDIKLDKLFRLADFTRWGYAAVEAAGIGGKKFLKAYEINQSISNDEAVESHPVAAAIVEMMKSQMNWEGSVSALLKKLVRVSMNANINTTSKVWPKAAHVLSRRLTEVKSNLEKKGIFFEIRHGGDARIITIEKKEVQKPKES